MPMEISLNFGWVATTAAYGDGVESYDSILSDSILISANGSISNAQICFSALLPHSPMHTNLLICP